MAIVLPQLPYGMDALEPVISARTLEFHHGKHHNAYVTYGNKLITGTKYEKMTIEEIIVASAGDSSAAGIFNNVAQTWNHSFYWQCMQAKGGGKPPAALLKKIDKDFGGFAAFIDEIKQAGATQFGSGWAWLIEESGKLKVTKTANADTPIAHKQHPLLTVDVWEHAYYLDFQNRRPDYLTAFFDKLVNWEFVQSQMS